MTHCLLRLPGLGGLNNLEIRINKMRVKELNLFCSLPSGATWLSCLSSLWAPTGNPVTQTGTSTSLCPQTTALIEDLKRNHLLGLCDSVGISYLACVGTETVATLRLRTKAKATVNPFALIGMDSDGVGLGEGCARHAGRQTSREAAECSILRDVID